MFRFFRRQKQEEEQAAEAPTQTAQVEVADAQVEAEQQQKVEASLQPTRRSIFRQIGELFSADEITPDLWDDLQDLLVLGDCGVDTTNYVLDALEKQVARDRIRRASTAYDLLKGLLVQVLQAPLARTARPGARARPCRTPTSCSLPASTASARRRPLPS